MAETTGTTGSTTSATRAGDGPARRQPTAAEAFRAQLALLARRWPGLLAVAAALAGLLVLAATGWIPAIDDMPDGVSLSGALAEAWTFYAVAALFWAPGLAWKDEGPSDRAYHWTLPVDRSTHQLLRLAAGWVLLVGVLAVGIAGGWAAGGVAQGGMAAGDPAVLTAVLPSATVLYLVGGLFALVTDRPLLWFVVAYLTLAGLEFLAGFRGWDWLVTLLAEVFGSGPLSLSAAVVLPQAVSGELGGSSVTWSPWRTAVLWLSVTAGLTVAAARLHLERPGGG